mgnify:CR=1 FL=1
MQLTDFLYLVNDKDGGTWCLGFLLTGAIIFTCRHCTNGSREILAIGKEKKYDARTIGYIVGKELYRKTKDGAIYEKSEYKTTYGKDMALLYVNGLENEKREIEEVFDDYRLFEQVYIPTPVLIRKRMRIGITKSNIIYADQDDEILLVSAPITPGTSGSPILNGKGKVVGMVSATLGGVIGIGIGSQTLYSFAKKILGGW